MISMLLHETFRTGLVFPSRSKWVQIVICYDQNLQRHKYLSGISMLLHETFRRGLVFLSRSKWVQTVVCYNQNLQKHKYLSTISMLSAQNLQNRAHFSEPVEMSPNSSMLRSKLTKNINISARISIFLHKTFRTGLIFLSQSKWVQTVVC